MYCLYCVVLCIVCIVLFYGLFVLCRSIYCLIWCFSVYCLYFVVLCIVCIVFFYVFCVVLFCVLFVFVVLCIVCIVFFYLFFVLSCSMDYTYCVVLYTVCYGVVLCPVCVVLLYALYVCSCVLYSCHRMPAQLQSTQYFIPSAKCFNNKTHLLAELMDDNCFITFMALLYTFPT